MGDERAAIAVNLCSRPVIEHMDMTFLSRGPDGLTIPPRHIATMIRCGCDDLHCPLGHHTCDDEALD